MMVNPEIGRIREILWGISKKMEAAARPSVVYKPVLNKTFDINGSYYWTAVYGDLYGAGNTPANAMLDFDEKWGREE
ncbi:hypothetical protein [Ferrovum sp.]|uniref:hypothetical protein n=1 Tax=Ferrovum sp. TaxID=2609467 RepID=UPI0026258E73|nr:hypothetical protein [Ferrovum sp.]